MVQYKRFASVLGEAKQLIRMTSEGAYSTEPLLCWSVVASLFKVRLVVQRYKPLQQTKSPLAGLQK